MRIWKNESIIDFQSLISLWRALPILAAVGFFLLLHCTEQYQCNFGRGGGGEIRGTKISIQLRTSN